MRITREVLFPVISEVGGGSQHGSHEYISGAQDDITRPRPWGMIETTGDELLLCWDYQLKNNQ